MDRLLAEGLRRRTRLTTADLISPGPPDR